MRSQKPSGKYQPHRARTINLLLALLCLSVLLFGFALFLNLRAQRQFRELSAQTHALPTDAAPAPATLPVVTKAPETALPPETTVPETTAGPAIETEAAVETEPQILPEYAALSAENPDFFGWIRIPDTRIDYPVMYSPEEPEKYLHAGFNGKYSFAGTPFLDGSCEPSSDNLLIYAHNMLDGSMFRSLIKYEQKDYWQKHPVIQFDTLYEKQEYEVLAAFYDRVYYQKETCFKFYQFIQAADEADFDNAIARFREKALYDTGVSVSYGEQLITLVTCAYHTDNGRFVVVAKKTRDADF